MLIINLDYNGPCIYKISNGEKFYIGSTINYRKRMRSHFAQLVKNSHRNWKLQRDFNKDNSNFKCEIIEKINDKNLLINREQYYLDSTDYFYNIASIAGSSLGIKRSKETKEKVRQANLGLKHPEWRNKLKSKAQGGENHWTKKKDIPFSEESKKKMSESQKKLYKNGYINPNKGKRMTEEQKQRIRETKSKAVYQLDLDLNIIKKWQSATIAGKELKINNSSITQCVKGNRKTAGKYKWRYV